MIEEDRLHLIPVNDLMVHHWATTCPCNPQQDPEDEMLWIHNAFDGRDFIEEEQNGSEERYHRGSHYN